MATLEESLEAIGAEYEPDTGFLGILHYRVFDVVASERFVAALRATPAQRDDLINHELVRLLWQVPLILSWKSGCVGVDFEDKLQRLIGAAEVEIERILGVA